MTADRHPIWQLLDRLQMDNRDQATKIVELRALIAGLELPDHSGREHRPYDPPADPAAQIRRLIGRTIHDHIDLEAELRAANLNGDQADELRALLPAEPAT